MELILLVLTLLAVDLVAVLFAADTRPGFEHSSRTLRPGTRRPGMRRLRGSHTPAVRPGIRRFIGG
jgi:hypothetical protein